MQLPHPLSPSLKGRGNTKKVDLVLSGVNSSSNVGDDVTYSGTVAGAMEGTVLGLPSIALSQACSDREKVYWQTAERHAPALIKKLIAATWPKNVLINLNFPDCPANKVKGTKVCPQGKRIVSVGFLERQDPKGRPYYWLGGARENEVEQPNVDVDLLDAGYITVTPLTMDLTDYKTMDKLRRLSQS